MDQREKAISVSLMQQYIASHLNEKMSLKKLADVAGYSPWHANRLFKEMTGKTPFEYIRACRLTKAAIQMRDGEPKKVVDVALDFLFDSHEGFTRAFSRQFGVAPKSYKKKPGPIPLFLPHQVKDYYQYLERKRSVQTMQENGKENDLQAVFVQVIERPARKAIILRGKQAEDYFAYCEEVGCDVWGVLTSVKEALYEPAGFWLPDSWIKSGTSRYVQGVEVPADYNGAVPEGYELIDMPACTMMIFQGEPYDDAEFGDAIDKVWQLMARYDPIPYGYAWAPESGPSFQLEPQGYRGYIEGKPVRKI